MLEFPGYEDHEGHEKYSPKQITLTQAGIGSKVIGSLKRLENFFEMIKEGKPSLDKYWKVSKK